MAGSAINLGGMLSQMANAMGTTGSNIGGNMFNPMLEMQKEERDRREKERLKAETLATNQENARLLSAPMMQAQRAINGDDARLLGQAAKNMQAAAIKTGKMEGVTSAAAMQGKVAEVRTKGALKGVLDINKALAGTVDPRAVEVLKARREELMAVDGVSEAMTKITDATDKAADETIKRKLEVKSAEDKQRINEHNQKVDTLTAGVVGGLDISKVPDEYRVDVQAAITSYNENLEKESEINAKNIPLADDVKKWAKNSDNPVVQDAIKKIENGAPEGTVSAYRKMISTAWKADHDYRTDRKRENEEALGKASANRRVEETLKHSATNWGMGEDVLEAMSSVDIEDREDSPLWIEARAIVEANPEISSRELAKTLVNNFAESYDTEKANAVFKDQETMSALYREYAAENPDVPEDVVRQRVDNIVQERLASKAIKGGNIN